MDPTVFVMVFWQGAITGGLVVGVTLALIMVMRRRRK